MAGKFLAEEATHFPALSDDFKTLQDAYRGALWFNVGQVVLKFTHVAGFPLIRFYDNFLKSIEMNLDPEVLGQFISSAATQIKDPTAARKFLEAALPKIESVKDALLIVKIQIAAAALSAGNPRECHDLLEKIQIDFDASSDLPTSLHSRLNRVYSDYYQVASDSSNYYRHTLLYLSYTPLEDIPEADRIGISSRLGLAAITGANVYNFGEVLQHPVLALLQQKPDSAWIFGLLTAFNQANIVLSEKIFAEKKDQPEIAQNLPALREKIRILALMALVFSKPYGKRSLPFEEIRRACDIPLEQVEWLVMKAMALEVIRGSIDQVGAMVYVDWLQPRILDASQIQSMKEATKKWRETVHQSLLTLEQNASELLK